MLDKQIHCYSVDTGNFYTAHERRLHWRNQQFRSERSYLNNRIKRGEARLERMKHTLSAGPEVVDTIRQLNQQISSSCLDSKFIAAAEKQRDELAAKEGIDIGIVLSSNPEDDISKFEDELNGIKKIKELKTAGANKTK